mgnify:CR=1 FL=1
MMSCACCVAHSSYCALRRTHPAARRAPIWDAGPPEAGPPKSSYEAMWGEPSFESDASTSDSDEDDKQPTKRRPHNKGGGTPRPKGAGKPSPNGMAAGGATRDWNANSMLAQVGPSGALARQYVHGCTGAPHHYIQLTHELRSFVKEVEPVITRMTPLQKSVGLEDPRTA